MYIIEEGKAYLVDGEVGYLTNFDTTGKMVVEKEKTIETEGKEVYTFDEMYKKLNIAYKIDEAKKQNALNGIENEVIDKLNATISELTKENNELKKQLEKYNEKKVEEPKVEEENTSKENKKNK